MSTSTKRLRIGIDIDGVLRAFVPDVIRIFKKHYPDVVVRPYKDWLWTLTHSIDLPREEIDYIIFNEHAREIFSQGSLESFENLTTLQHMIAEDLHDMIIVTHQYPGVERYSYQWLGNCGINVKEVYMHKDKTKAKCDILLDDGMYNLERVKGPVCYDQPWNQSWTGPRVFSMKEFYDQYYVNEKELG